MATLLPLVSLITAAILQTTIVSQITMLQGSADLVLLTLVSWVLLERTDTHWRWGLLAGILIGAVSAIPIFVPVVGYSLVVGFIWLLQTRIWQAPVLILFSATLFGNFVVYGLELGYVWFSGATFNFIDVLNLVLLPSLVLNMLLVLPLYGFINELAKQVYPMEIDV